MKKSLTVSIVLIMFVLLFTAQNCLAQKDPFEIGKEIAMTGGFDSNIWAKDAGRFGVMYNTERNAVFFTENPASGDGTVVSWAKEFGSNANYLPYVKYTFIVENNEIKQETGQVFPITQEKAEQEAWRILKHLGYSK